MIQKIKDTFNRFLPTKKKKIIAVIILILLVLVLGKVFFGSSPKEDEGKKTERKVEIARVYDVIATDINLPVVGNVESQSEATLRVQSQGEISGIYKRLGDFVQPGTIIAEIRNDSQRAEVLRAQGVYEAARANFSGNVSIISNTIRQSFNASDDAIRTKVDQLFINVQVNKADMVIALQDPDQRRVVEAGRIEIEAILDDWNNSINTLNSSISENELPTYLNEAQINLSKVSSYLNEVSKSLATFEVVEDVTSQSDINRYRSDVSASRSAVSNSLSSLISSSNSFGSGDTVLASEAQVTQARAGLLSAQANLEKTIVRSPIKGQVNALNVGLGDVVSSFEEVAHIVGNGGVEIVAYINDEDRERIDIDSDVLIDGKYNGKVSRIAPAINPSTSKVEVRITPNEETGLRNGQSVSLKINRDLEVNEGVQIISLPISAVKITAEESLVFIFDPENSVVNSKPVSIGNILGDRIVITDGILLEDVIILDSRGLKDGQKVTY
ncbi:MAG: multidrug efflux pump subunit AcrA (membrane-fusion protein) [Candidatus Paceibacteria bacterium]|jgi:multidrug efflux pump subunit AcrA (membrane-fusion protein)